MSNQNAEQTNKNLEQFLLNDRTLNRYFNAPIRDEYTGWISGFGFPGRTYFEQFIVDEVSELMYIEFSIDVLCLKPYRRILGEYLEKINSIMKNGKVCINSNGHVYIHIAQYFKDNPIDVDTIREMERNLIIIAEEYGENIQMAANGCPVSEDEDKIKGMIEKMMMNRDEDETEESDRIESLGTFEQLLDSMIEDMKSKDETISNDLIDETVEANTNDNIIIDLEERCESLEQSTTTMEDTLKSIMESETDGEDSLVS